MQYFERETIQVKKNKQTHKYISVGTLDIFDI